LPYLYSLSYYSIATEIRLVDGNNNLEGRVEILYNGIWGTVCDDSWSIQDAHVICRQLGFGHALQATVRANFGQGTGTIWLDNVLCIGSETRIEDCTHNGWGTHNCAHSEDAGVVCSAGKLFYELQITTYSCVYAQNKAYESLTYKYQTYCSSPVMQTNIPYFGKVIPFALNLSCCTVYTTVPTSLHDLVWQTGLF